MRQFMILNPGNSKGECAIRCYITMSLLLCAELQSSLREWVGAETCLLGAYDVKHLTFPLLIFPLPCGNQNSQNKSHPEAHYAVSGW